jgi:predicted ATP-grasp superfamily ATP-dependent carboligase
VDALPQLQNPVLLIALRGWVDAGDAGEVAVSTLAGQLRSRHAFGRYDLSDLVDLQQTRPTVSLEDGTTRRIEWPAIEIEAGNAGRDVVTFVGPEPSLRWPTFVKELSQLAVQLGVTQAFALGGMPAVTSHRRPVSVLATATSHSLAQEIGAMRTDYAGPTGVQTVLQVALGDAGIPSVGLWAQVPHYVAGNFCPPAVSALLTRLQELAGIQVDVSELDEQADTYKEKVEEGLAERPDVADLVTAIEQETQEEVSGDALAAEIERFLRDQ